MPPFTERIQNRLFGCPCPTKSKEECMAFQKSLFEGFLILLIACSMFGYFFGFLVGSSKIVL